MITRFIREASGDKEVYLLLAAYVEATRLHAKVSSHSRHAANTPLDGPDVVKRWIEALFLELSAASTGLDDNFRGVVKDALYVFGEALMRLKVLGRTNPTLSVDTDLNLEAEDSVRPRLDAFTALARTQHSSLGSPAR